MGTVRTTGTTRRPPRSGVAEAELHERRPLRIDYAANSAIPSRSANSLQVMKMCGAFAAAGHDVRLLIPKRAPVEADRSLPAERVRERYGVRESFPIVRLPWPRLRGRFLAFGLAATGAARLRSPDLLYCRALQVAFLGIRAGLDVIYESHVPPEHLGSANRWFFERIRMSPRLVRVVVISDALARHFREVHRIPADKVVVARSGTDMPPADLRPERLAGGGDMKVGYVGHLYPGKGMEVISRVAPLCPWADFHVVGGTPEDIEHWRSSLASAANVHFHGFMEPHRLDAFRAAFDVCLLPLQREVFAAGGGLDIGPWTSPLKAFEYLAAGKPIIASDVPPLREIFDEGTAILVPPDDVAGWAAALDWLRDGGRRDRFGAQARRLAKEYTWDRRVDLTLGALGP
jgi:glycosyltransferase involved in cell wall biosynthesis